MTDGTFKGPNHAEIYKNSHLNPMQMISLRDRIGLKKTDKVEFVETNKNGESVYAITSGNGERKGELSIKSEDRGGFSYQHFEAVKQESNPGSASFGVGRSSGLGGEVFGGGSRDKLSDPMKSKMEGDYMKPGNLTAGAQVSAEAKFGRATETSGTLNQDGSGAHHVKEVELGSVYGNFGVSADKSNIGIKGEVGAKVATHRTTDEYRTAVDADADGKISQGSYGVSMEAGGGAAVGAELSPKKVGVTAGAGLVGGASVQVNPYKSLDDASSKAPPPPENHPQVENSPLQSSVPKGPPGLSPSELLKGTPIAPVRVDQDPGVGPLARPEAPSAPTDQGPVQLGPLGQNTTPAAPGAQTVSANVADMGNGAGRLAAGGAGSESVGRDLDEGRAQKMGDGLGQRGPAGEPAVPREAGADVVGVESGAVKLAGGAGADALGRDFGPGEGRTLEDRHAPIEADDGLRGASDQAGDGKNISDELQAQLEEGKGAVEELRSQRDEGKAAVDELKSQSDEGKGAVDELKSQSDEGKGAVDELK
ncbi:MAG: hypothetical protein EPN98_08040, partial [Phenylobacterium sp.]|uniref:hypothetical protein n=1 Tax=Phenylobacterium sp. TaxID=1871053 RepID=UPI0011F961F5